MSEAVLAMTELMIVFLPPMLAVGSVICVVLVIGDYMQFNHYGNAEECVMLPYAEFMRAFNADMDGWSINKECLRYTGESRTFRIHMSIVSYMRYRFNIRKLISKQSYQSFVKTINRVGGNYQEVQDETIKKTGFGLWGGNSFSIAFRTKNNSKEQEDGLGGAKD